MRNKILMKPGAIVSDAGMAGETKLEIDVFH